MDGQFGCIRGDLADIKANLNICSNGEHMGKIERLNRTIKKRARRVYNTTPFKNVPGRMIVEIADLVVLWLNALPMSPSIVGGLSP